MPSYALRDSMLDPIEQSLYRALSGVLCQRALLFTKINLGDLFTPLYQPVENELGALAHQRIDFVLCDRDSMRPLAIILFTDSTPRPGQVDHAEAIAQVCDGAGLPLVRLERQSAYFMHQLIPLIETLLTSNARRDDYTNGERANANTHYAGAPPTPPNGRRSRKSPAYPGYGALRTIANKLV